MDISIWQLLKLVLNLHFAKIAINERNAKLVLLLPSARLIYEPSTKIAKKLTKVVNFRCRYILKEFLIG